MTSAPPPSTYPDDLYLAADKGPQVLASICAIAAATTLFVAARIFVQAVVKNNVQIDDYLIVLSTLFAWACVGLSIEAVRWGNGKHFDLLSLEEKQAVVKFTIIAFPPGIFSFSLPKFAIVSLLTRLLNPSRWHRIFLWSLAGVCQLVLLGCIIILFAQCQPSSALWDFSLAPQATCWDKWVLVHYSMFAGSFSAVTDLYLAVYPTVVLFSLRIELRKKIALCCALGIGSVSTIVAIYKTTRIPSLASADFSYETSDLVIWTIVEGSTLIIAACIPILQPLMDLAIGRTTLRSSRSHKSGGGAGGGYNKHTGAASGSGTGTGTKTTRSAVGGVGVGVPGGEFEMHRAGWRRFGRPRDPDEDLLRTNATVTLVDRGGDEEDGRRGGMKVAARGSSSQESILAPVAEEGGLGGGGLGGGGLADRISSRGFGDDDSRESRRGSGGWMNPVRAVSTVDSCAPSPGVEGPRSPRGIVRTREVRVEYRTTGSLGRNF
ncbi:hypothetical protein N658DRAFT_167018 [Parathielavia hyrcaniae]|uniref:Rhodopsin domain-containing protein n=1 Tax=Parathielavia hyrcaniae TaxID=113614 RepID=A0AAN6PWV4_9PEZI|nr:hypothetical protein N658DRAFT_167018 [Parathielavia hyrcaniae]